MRAELTQLIPPSTKKLIPPYLSRHEISSGAMWGGAGMEMAQGEIARLFLLSNLTECQSKGIKPIIYKPIKRVSRSKKKSTKRPQYKSTTKSEVITHDSIKYSINSAKSGVLTEIMHKAISQSE